MIAWAMTFAKSQGLKGQAATEVAAKLAEAELSKARLSQQCRQWSSAAGELEGLLRDKQDEVHQLKLSHTQTTQHAALLQSTLEVSQKQHQQQLQQQQQQLQQAQAQAQQTPAPPPPTGDARSPAPSPPCETQRQRQAVPRATHRRAS